jgi:LuxR family transcriptional regulator, maltose regulon positive regulatory protein
VFLQITPSERDALELLANGTTTDEIARCLGVTVSDVEARLVTLFQKMGTTTRRDAVAAALRRGLLSTPDSRTMSANLGYAHLLEDYGGL